MDKKTRIKLRSLASTIKPVVWIGKDGLSENAIKQIADELFNHELIKISIQENAPILTSDELDWLQGKTGAEVVTSIGRKLVLYKLSEKKNIKHIL